MLSALFAIAFNADPPDPPQGYAYQYAVKDSSSGTSFDKIEQNDGYSTSGQYRVLLPDGRTQIVNYHTDDTSGYTAEVFYQGNITHGSATKPVIKTIHRTASLHPVADKG